jgi:hypothetical protein
VAVPITAPAWVSFDSAAAPIARAMPKSATFTCPFVPMRMFAGLTSRWTSPAPWANASAAATSLATSAACLLVSGPLERRMSASVRPCTYSMAMK